MDDFIYCPMCRSELAEREIDRRKRRACPLCGWVNYKNPLPAVACLVSKREEGRSGILLVKRAVEPYKGAWCIPGGFIESGETLSQAGSRELEEETGLIAEPSGYFAGAYVQKSRMYGEVLIVGLEFAVKNGSLAAGDDAQDARFVPLSDIPDIPLESHRRLINSYLSHLCD